MCDNPALSYYAVSGVIQHISVIYTDAGNALGIIVTVGDTVIYSNMIFETQLFKLMESKVQVCVFVEYSTTKQYPILRALTPLPCIQFDN